jgi:XTP/dITP diphosphohydrolase
MDLLIATGNPGKVREYQALFEQLPVRCLGPADLGIALEVTEHGSSYQENALLKALPFARASGKITLADDSGLEVDALNGRPGVYSARYGGPGLADADRWRLLLEELLGVPWEARAARFRCVIAVARPDGLVETAEGICEGRIAGEAAGSGGFGYDPVFYLPEFDCTMAELPEGVKNTISHRARAAHAARRIILQWTNLGD